MEEQLQSDGMSRCASAPTLQQGGNSGAKLNGMALVLTTPRRQTSQQLQQQQQQRSRRQRPQVLEPLRDPTDGDQQRATSSSSRPHSTANQQKRQRSKMNSSIAELPDIAGGCVGEEEGDGNLRVEVVRLRKQLHRQACESAEAQEQLVITKRELWQVRAEADELRLKLSNLERIDRTKSSELLQERRKNDEMLKQVKEMSANLLSLTGSLDGGSGNQEGSGLRKRCFKLVQQNTALSVQCRLLQRQKGWAEAKARVLQNEVTRVYLGVHDRVKDEAELESVMLREVCVQQFPTDEARMYQPLMPNESLHGECVVDFLTHITHTHGMDIHGFLQSSRVFSEGIRNDCLGGLAREFYATWRRNAILPHILRAVERVVHLSDYLAAFEAFSAEIANLLGCAHARIWIVDRFRQCMWSCIRDGDGQKTFTLNLPKGKDSDLTRQGIAGAAYLTQRIVNVEDVRTDPRFSPEEEAGGDGHAKSMMCVPVCRNSKAGRQPQVCVVLQAVNKLQEPYFDPDRDGRILKLLGKVSMEVWQVCETGSASSMNTKRKDSLLQLFTENLPCDSPQMLLAALERGLGETFLAHATALHVVQGHSTILLTINKHQNKVVQMTCEGMKGIVGMVAKTMNQNTILSSQVEGTKYDGNVDLPNVEKTVIHTVPICEGSGCVAVCQFACPEREKSLVGDDGAYHPENTSHFRLLLLLLTFVQKHLYVVNGPRPPNPSPSPRMESKEDAKTSRESTKQEENAVKSKARGSVVYSDQESAAVLIQAASRGRMTRIKTNMLKMEKNINQPSPTRSRQTSMAALDVPGGRRSGTGKSPRGSRR